MARDGRALLKGPLRPRAGAPFPARTRAVSDAIMVWRLMSAMVESRPKVRNGWKADIANSAKALMLLYKGAVKAA
jgi:hypothetical protein